MRRFTLQLVKRELPAGPPLAKERTRQIMFANLRRRVYLADQLPFKVDGRPGELEADFIYEWLSEMNMASEVDSIESTSVRACACMVCGDARRGTGHMAGLLDGCDLDAAYHLHWDHEGHHMSIGIVTLMPQDVLRTWKAPKLNQESDVVHAIDMIVDDRLIWCVNEGADDSWLKETIREDIEAAFPPLLAEGLYMGEVNVAVQHIGNRSIVRARVEVKSHPLKLLYAAEGGRTLLTKDLR